MSRLLTIAIPSYNRAHLLNKQLTWLAQAIKGFESECEIIISDNYSIDNTQNVIKKWQFSFGDALLKLNRNSENIGAVKNIAYCMKAATSRYVWVISDDDTIFDQTLAYVIDTLNKYPQLGLIVLNFSTRHAITDQVIEERCYNIENDEVSFNGKAIFARCLEQAYGGVGLTTALVCRTDLIQLAIEQWAVGLDNLAVQVYWSAFCAFHGGIKVTKDNYLECLAGTHHFLQVPRLLVQLEFADKPEVFAKMIDIGYSKNFVRKIVLDCFKTFNWKVLLGGLKRWPLTSIKAINRYLGLVWLVTIGFNLESASTISLRQREVQLPVK